MTARDRAELARLSVELGADLVSLDELAKSLSPWEFRAAGEARRNSQRASQGRRTSTSRTCCDTVLRDR